MDTNLTISSVGPSMALDAVAPGGNSLKSSVIPLTQPILQPRAQVDEGSSSFNSSPLPLPPGSVAHRMVTPSAAEDVLDKLFGGISGERSGSDSTGLFADKGEDKTALPILARLSQVDPIAMMLMVTSLSMETSTQKIGSLKDSNRIYADGQDKALASKLEEFKKQLEEQQKAEEKAQKSKVLGQVFGWLGVLATAIAALFNPALWVVVAISATSMALQTAVDVMGDKAPQALKSAAQVFGGISMAAGLATAGVGALSSILKSASSVAQKLGETVTKVVAKVTEKFVENTAAKVGAIATGLTESSKSIGTTVLNKESSDALIDSLAAAFSVKNLDMNYRLMGESTGSMLRRAADEGNDLVRFLQGTSNVMSDTARVNSRIIRGLA
ncbi:Secreted protein EspD [Edwardsiella anguillarum]|nr:Secreted protein EspD [Edwardsiella anguillarum]BET85541.1 Secreted protein EspD [Edwardsiella anguillarum]BET88904.1 Secreted protein EspD [Edwardsiella anguillarum]BET92195.1 Secreted protein EspD [Edwardsiella anguillarum]GAJ68486.1 secretion system effector C (SseC) like family protein [Edwardsiella piscicida]